MINHGRNYSETVTNRDDKASVSWIDVIYWLLSRKKKIAIAVFSVMALTAVMTLLMNKWYESVAVVVLPEKTGGALDAIMSSGTGSGSLTGLGAAILGGGAGSNTARYLAILNSRRLREEMMNRYHLKEEYNVERTEDVLKILEKDLVVTVDKKLGTIQVIFRFFGDAEKTAEMTNFVVEKLDEINRELSTEQARFTRRFIEERYVQSKRELEAAEDSLNVFQKKYGVISLTDQTKAGIEAAAQLHMKIVAVETELNVKKNMLGEHHPDILRLASELKELRKNQSYMKSGGPELSVFIPFTRVPDLGLEYLRLYRSIQINSKIVEFLVPQFEQAKIQEAKDTPTLLVLDKAKAAESSFKPKKRIVTLMAGIVAFILTVCVLYVKEEVIGPLIVENPKWAGIVDAIKPRNWFR